MCPQNKQALKMKIMDPKTKDLSLCEDMLT